MDWFASLELLQSLDQAIEEQGDPGALGPSCLRGILEVGQAHCRQPRREPLRDVGETLSPSLHTRHIVAMGDGGVFELDLPALELFGQGPVAVLAALEGTSKVASLRFRSAREASAKSSWAALLEATMCISARLERVFSLSLS